jgi:hypothetical protein
MVYLKYSTEPEPYRLWSIRQHGYLSLPLSTIGVIFNIFSITIFSQKTMRSSTNFILMSISTCDLLLMLAYVPYSIYFHLISTPDPYPDQVFFSPYFLLFYNHFSVFAHACSVSYNIIIPSSFYLIIISNF